MCDPQPTHPMQKINSSKSIFSNFRMRAWIFHNLGSANNQSNHLNRSTKLMVSNQYPNRIVRIWKVFFTCSAFLVSLKMIYEYGSRVEGISCLPHIPTHIVPPRICWLRFVISKNVLWVPTILDVQMNERPQQSLETKSVYPKHCTNLEFAAVLQSAHCLLDLPW